MNRTSHAEGQLEPNTQSRVEELAGGIRELADEEKDGLLDLLMKKGF